MFSKTARICALIPWLGQPAGLSKKLCLLQPGADWLKFICQPESGLRSLLIGRCPNRKTINTNNSNKTNKDLNRLRVLTLTLHASKRKAILLLIFSSKCSWIAKTMHVSLSLSSGQICSDSMQCADFCCREVRGHRSRYYVCGTPEDDLMSYTCIQASRTGNDVLDNLI